ncbi:hypothetical protein GGS21DRAFT_102913 [Xylaria nigripes]|nr:hypothetical protein GGS21DRAFT_102913 [Xylaria nigripes]
MHWYMILTTLIGYSLANTPVVHDDETGFTFLEYEAGHSIALRFAIPKPASEGFDLVFQIDAPAAAGWAGFAWGGTMIDCPLTVGWAFEDSGFASVRRTSSHIEPSVYTGATVGIFSKGTHVNGSRWQITAKCSGCSSFITSDDTTRTNLNPNGTNRLAFAYSGIRPGDPSSTAALAMHDGYGAWDADFSVVGNADFDQLVSRNA